MSVDHVKNIDFNKVKPSRSGIIVYTRYQGKTYFILGIDTVSGDITDFGGGVSVKTENAITGGLREFSEESLGIFGEITIEELKRCVCVYDESNIIIFVPIKIDISRKYYEFINRLKLIKYPEVKDLSILDTKEFISLINGNDIDGNIMYDKIRKLLFSGKGSGLLRCL